MIQYIYIDPMYYSIIIAWYTTFFISSWLDSCPRCKVMESRKVGSTLCERVLIESHRDCEHCEVPTTKCLFYIKYINSCYIIAYVGQTSILQNCSGCASFSAVSFSQMAKKCQDMQRAQARDAGYTTPKPFLSVLFQGLKNFEVIKTNIDLNYPSSVSLQAKGVRNMDHQDKLLN